MAHTKDCRCERCRSRATEKLPELVVTPDLAGMTEEVRRGLENLSTMATARVEQLVKDRLDVADNAALAGVADLKANVERAYERIVTQLGRLEQRVSDLERYLGRGE